MNSHEITAVTEQVEAKPTVFKSRWGWHPCDYATFRLLRNLSRAYWQARRQAGLRKRWLRKDAKNRVSRPRVRDEQGRVVGYGDPTPLPEPVVDGRFAEVFPETETYWDGTAQKVTSRPSTKRFNVVDTAPWVPAALRAARHPAPSPAEVVPLPVGPGELARLAEALK